MHAILYLEVDRVLELQQWSGADVASRHWAQRAEGPGSHRASGRLVVAVAVAWAWAEGHPRPGEESPVRGRGAALERVADAKEGVRGLALVRVESPHMA